VCFAIHPNCAKKRDFEPRVTSIFQKTGIDVWAGMTRRELLRYNWEYSVFADVVYGQQVVCPRLQGRGPSGSGSSSSMPLGIALSSSGAGGGSMPLGSAPRSQDHGPSSASSSSMPPGLAPSGTGTDSGSMKKKARPSQANSWPIEAKRIREDGTRLLVTMATPSPCVVVPVMGQVTRLHEDRTGLTTTAAEVQGTRSTVAIQRPSSAQQTARMPRLCSPSSSSESESPEERDDTPLPDMRMEEMWSCPECKSINLRFYAACCLCCMPRPFLQDHRAGDWICGLCGNTNFAWRTWCAWSTCSSCDWICKCGNTNFARRAFCNMRCCHLPRSW
jgi:hypothetical protein